MSLYLAVKVNDVEVLINGGSLFSRLYSPASVRPNGRCCWNPLFSLKTKVRY